MSKILLVSPHPLFSNAPLAGSLTSYYLYKQLTIDHTIDIICWGQEDEIVKMKDEKVFNNIYPIIRNGSSFYHLKLLITSFFSNPILQSKLFITILGYVLKGEKKYFGKITSFYFASLRSTLSYLNKNNYDILILEHSELQIISKFIPHKTIIVSMVDVLSNIEYFKKFRNGKLLEKIKLLEEKNAGYIKGIIVQSNKDYLYIKKRFPSVAVCKINPFIISMGTKRNSNKNNNKKVLLFSGAFDREANVQSANFIIKDILPTLFNDLDIIKMLFVGNSPPDELIKKTENWKEKVIFTGYVDDISEYYACADIFLCPHLAGGGILVKFLTALKFGIPVIANSIANEGVNAVPNSDFILANNGHEFVEGIKKLINDDRLYNLIAENGKKYFQNNFDHSKNHLALNSLIKEIQ